jgi:pyruvate formate lyase activating enzyme
MGSGLVFNIQRYSLHDGPGIRTTVFLKGCPLDCWWCHNPESQRKASEILVMENRCISCDHCAAVCPLGRATHDVNARLDGGDLCARCVEACPTEARQWVGTVMTGPEVLEQVARDIPFYEQSGGGVTFSGGEPLLHFAFLQELLAGCRERGIHSTVDTCGFAPWDHFAAIAPLTGLFLYDIKQMDDARHKEVTGVSNARILENLRRLSEIHPTVWIRIPLIPGINDTAENLRAMASFIASLPGHHPVNLLPYHATGRNKFARVGKAYLMPDSDPHTRVALSFAAACFESEGLTATVIS